MTIGSQLVALPRNCACPSLSGRRGAVVDDRIASGIAFARKRKQIHPNKVSKPKGLPDNKFTFDAFLRMCSFFILFRL